ncbi:DinB family protein [Psychrobacillus sp. NPDC058041]|uniref:DinB family protein n=1 Tax=Psychrobacillus sp. NPDC058041 TaxID=3346310 RepID=UPI0036DC7CC0
MNKPPPAPINSANKKENILCRNNELVLEIAEPSFTNLAELVELLSASNEHLLEAMSELSEEDWHKNMESPIGASTPLEAVGRLMYHTGIHAGQISLIQKNGHSQVE